VPIHLAIAAKVKIVILNVNGNVHPQSATKSANQFANSHVAPPVAKNWAAANVLLNVINQNAKYVVQSNIVKKVLALNVILFVKNQPVILNVQIQHLPVNPSAKNHFAIGNVTVQQIAKNLNVHLSVKNHHIVNPKHHQPIAVVVMQMQQKKKMVPKQNVVDATKKTVLLLPVVKLETVHHLDAKLWNCNAQVTAPPKPTPKKHLAKPLALNLHLFAHNVVVR